VNTPQPVDSTYTRIVKPLADRTVAVLLALLLSPLIIVIAIIIKLESPGPVIFRHLRYGRDKQPFMFYKFRSMAHDTPADVPTSELADAHMHITRFGKFLRKSSLDELAQLFNVTCGHMSFIGPRPVILAEEYLIRERAKHGANSVRPGITGWAQINGRDKITVRRKAELDGYYAQHIGFWFDIKCVLLTFWAVAFSTGHAEGHKPKDDNLAVST
jgi:O-antigen biosynthesis protein WbqP